MAEANRMDADVVQQAADRRWRQVLGFGQGEEGARLCREHAQQSGGVFEVMP
jgi:hypothetical protein